MMYGDTSRDSAKIPQNQAVFWEVENSLHSFDS